MVVGSSPTSSFYFRENYTCFNEESTQKIYTQKGKTKMTRNAKDIMVGLLGAYGVIVAIGTVVGGTALAVINHKEKKAAKELEAQINSWKFG